MKYTSDLHTHTVASGHAYSTLLENVEYCVKNNIKILGVSDHGPNMPGAPHEWYFGNMKVIPRYIDGILILKGCEANILNTSGEIDLSQYQVDKLDYMIASLHEPVFAPGQSEEVTTQAILNAIDLNPKIEILGHLGNPNYKINYKTIVKKAKEKDIIIEINNSSLMGTSRVGSDVNCKSVAELCKKYGTKVIMTSDAHISFAIGNFEYSEKLLKTIDMPEELIMNNPEQLIKHLKSKGRLKDI